jgi:hypothetical protein
MIATMAALVISALLVAFATTTMLQSNGNSSDKLNNAPGVGLANDVSAQQALQTSLSAADDQAAEAGGFDGVTLAGLATSDSSVTYVDGPSTNPSTISVAITGGGSAGGFPSGGDGSGVAGDGSGGLGDGGTGGGTGSDPGAGALGAITLAIRSDSGTCWLAWKGGDSAPWFGEQTHLRSCTAPSLSSAPQPSPVSSTTIGWRQGAFPVGG